MTKVLENELETSWLERRNFSIPRKDGVAGSRPVQGPHASDQLV